MSRIRIAAPGRVILAGWTFDLGSWQPRNAAELERETLLACIEYLSCRYGDTVREPTDFDAERAMLDVIAMARWAPQEGETE